MHENKYIYLLVIFISAVSAYLLFDSFQKLQTVFSDSKNTILIQQQKNQLLTAMYNAARERSIILLKMLDEQDDFVLDELNQEMGEFARQFIKARTTLSNLPLSGTERIFLAKQDKLTGKIAPSQDRVAESLLNGDRPAAMALLFNEALPGQIDILEHIDRVLEEGKKKVNISIENLSQVFQTSTRRIVWLFFLLIGSSLLIVAIVIRRSSHRERFQLKKAVHEREKRVRETEKSRELLSQQHERIHITLQSIVDGVITTHADGQVEFLNPVAEKLTGWTTHEATGKPLSEIFSITNETTGETLIPSDPAGFKETVIAGIERRSSLIHRDGTHLYIEASTAPIFNNQKDITGIVVVFRDVTDEHILHEQISYQATHDSLTGIWNRTAFEKKLVELQTDSHESGSTHALLYLDLDQFKVVNDTAGHIAGDELLKQITREYSQIVRGSDMLARIGGDEFAVLLQNCDEKHALKVAEKLRLVMQSHKFIWDDKHYQIGVSIGIAMITKDSQSTHVMSQADLVCYKAKSDGRNNVHLYQASDEELSAHFGEMHWVSKIQEALEQHQFILYGQKIIPIANTEKTINYQEILVRLEEKSGEIIPPNAFIPAAERYNLMSKIDKFVFEKSCSWLLENHQQDTRLSINLSGQSLGDSEFLDFIEKKLAHHPGMGQLIVFEITETAAISNLRTAVDFMNKLIDHGASFSLDDFGSGLSSFAYLKNMPVSYIKIDGGFVHNMVNDSVDAAMVHAITQVGQKLGIKTVAEFVENQATLNILKEYGVDYAQGFYIGKPEPLMKRIEDSTEKEIAVMPGL